MKEGLHIVLSSEKLGEFLSIPITNTLLMSWLVMAVLIGIALVVRYRLKIIPGKLQVLFESLFDFVLDYMAETLENRKLAQRFFPLIMTLFLFILLANLFGLLPGVGSIFYNHNGQSTELLHPVHTDLNMTLALTLIVFFVIEITGIVMLGALKYGAKFVTLTSFLGFATGLIELFSELARLISFSFRLFGNMFAGKVLILVAVAFVPFILPVPLMMFEIFVALIQAAIFSLLTLFFIKVAITEAHEAH